jgi:hypothetical protein
MLCPTARNSLWIPCSMITYSLVSIHCILLYRLQHVHHSDGLCCISKWLTRPLVTKLGQSVSNMKHMPMSSKGSYSIQFSWKYTTFYLKSIYIHYRQGKIHCAFAYRTISVVWQYKSGPNICNNEHKICMSKSLKEKHNVLIHIISQNYKIHIKHSKVSKKSLWEVPWCAATAWH